MVGKVDKEGIAYCMEDMVDMADIQVVLGMELKLAAVEQI
jgi:hypothetical protein